MWASQRELKFKVLQSGSERKWEEKNWSRLKGDFVFWWLALPKRVSLGRQWGAARRVKGSWGSVLEGRRDVNYCVREKEVCLGLLGSLIVAAPRAILWLGCTQTTKKGFLHLFIQFHAMSTLKRPPFPLQNCTGHPNPLLRERALMGTLFLACCSFLSGEEG